jgi:hypothetical protein
MLMSSHKRREDWIDDDEYPDVRDMERFGEDSALDNDPLSIGRVPNFRYAFWTRGRIVAAIVIAILLFSIVVLPLLNR